MSGSKSSPPAASADEPLTLTVHSLPTAGEPAVRRQLSGRWKMLALMLVCAAPVIVSYFMYYVVRPEGRKNYGELIQPARALPAVQARLLDGKAYALQALQGQWLLVSVAGGACDEACQKRIYWTRQLREVMGRDKDRIERIWLVMDDAAVDAKLVPQVHAPLNDAQALRVDAATLSAWLPSPAAGQKIEEHIYVVDPYGNLMLRWPVDIDAAKAKRDVHNLLRASGSWDQAGRVGGSQGGLLPKSAQQGNPVEAK
ncbi:hypothetical protein [Variovorax sp. PCZ-1]|uniref:hypothetical protein n=1 Tax=Variovorax sp. PCZ-1 TaxID=2835533 RepID=UPI001BD0EA2E|nr:hypothetical protein [Variovorax sp. PCZ-1]MBS7808319.1 hypothetical protein [Variovorax sp. PCZ-1]